MNRLKESMENCMERIAYDEDKLKLIRKKVQQLIRIVNELEKEFPGRHFTLDGHLVGSIGEVMASYFYGIELYKASAETHDGEVGGRKVQVKITQQDTILIAEKPDYLIALYLTRKGDIYEIYNGPGDKPWETAYEYKRHNNRYMQVNKLMSLDADVDDDDRIAQKNRIEKMKKEFKNPKKKK